MWVGLRDVFLDYARPTGLRNVLPSPSPSACSASAWIARILLRCR